jgi:hypothetical protein
MINTWLLKGWTCGNCVAGWLSPRMQWCLQGKYTSQPVNPLWIVQSMLNDYKFYLDGHHKICAEAAITVQLFRQFLLGWGWKARLGFGTTRMWTKVSLLVESLPGFPNSLAGMMFNCSLSSMPLYVEMAFPSKWLQKT